MQHIFGVILACIGLMLAAGGGIGGGGILVPIYIIVMGFSPKYAVPLSNITILGGAIANNAFNLFKRHPDPSIKRPLIDYDLVLLMEPTTIAGAVLGSILNKLLPEYIIATLLVIVLGLTTLKTLKTGNKLYLKEEEEESSHTRTPPSWSEAFSSLFDNFSFEEDVSAPVDEASQPLVTTQVKAEIGEDDAETKAIELEESRLAGLPDEDVTKKGSLAALQERKEALIWAKSKGKIAMSQGSGEEMAAILAEESESFPLWKIGAISMCFLVVIICNVTKSAATTCGSGAYWFLMFVPVLITVSMMVVVRHYLLEKCAAKRSAGGPDWTPPEGDMDWNDTTTVTYPLICTLAGVFAGMFGIGGGIVKGPLMVEMGILPQVSAATAAFMILYTTASATVTYAAFDLIAWNFAAVLFPIGMIFTALGQVMVNGYIKRTGRSSVIVFVIAGIVGLSTLLMGYQSIVSSVDALEHSRGIAGICETTESVTAAL